MAVSVPSQRLAQPNRVPERMAAAQIVAPQTVALVDVPVPQPGPDEVLVQVTGCGLCGSNLPVWEGREWFSYPLPPGNPGHEGWGKVAALGEAYSGDLEVGDRVSMLSYAAFAAYDVAQAGALIKLPPELAAQPFPAEPLACAFNVFARSNIQPGQQVAIVGIGFLGALLTALAVDAGAEVIAITRRPFALDVARGYGAAHTLVLDDPYHVVDQVKQITHAQGCDCVIEAVGAQGPLDLATELTAVRGRLVIAGYHQDGLRQVNMQVWNWRGLDVINAHERDQAVYVAGMQAAAAAVASGRLDPAPLYTHRFSLAELGDACRIMQQRPEGFLKALIEV